MYSIPYSWNMYVELNLAVGKINFVLPNFIPSTFNTCIKNSNNTAYSTRLPNIITANISGYAATVAMHSVDIATASCMM